MKELIGTGVALVTPFTSTKKVDYEALEKLINHVVKGGVDYLVTMGTTGETPVLSSQEKKSIINFTFEVVKNRMPIVVGVGGNDTAAVLQDLAEYPLQNALAVLSASPYYSKPSQQGILEHYKAIAKKSPKPIILYNVPGRTGRNMTAATTLALANERNIIAMKEASGDMQQCMQILKDKPKDFIVLSGDDALALPQIACGMKGVISVAANAYPKQFSTMVNYCLINEFAKAVQINNKLMAAYDLMFAENNPAGVKAFLAEMEILQNQLRLPGVPVSRASLKLIKEYIVQNA